MADKIVLLAGTRKGLFAFYTSVKHDKWVMKGPYLKGWQIYHAITDTRGKPMILDKEHTLTSAL